MVEGINDEVVVWLTETDKRFLPCHCPNCAGGKSFLLETDLIARAHTQVRERFPWLRLTLTLSQGSRDAGVNEAILQRLPLEIVVAHYDGVSRFGSTYVTDRRPMVEAHFEQAARAGRRIVMVPQLTHSWRTVFPMTAPQFVHFRTVEFAGKDMAGLIAWNPPTYHYHSTNIAAMGERSWNAAGRTPALFARAFAVQRGDVDPSLYADWTVRISPLGWDLAEARIMIRAISEPDLGFTGSPPYHRYFCDPKRDLHLTSLTDRTALAAAIAEAGAARDIAVRAGAADMIAESDAVTALLESFGLLNEISRLLYEPPNEAARLVADRARLAEKAEALEKAATDLEQAVRVWGDAIHGKDHRPPDRFEDSATALRQVAARVRAAAQTFLGDSAEPYGFIRG